MPASKAIGPSGPVDQVDVRPDRSADAHLLQIGRDLRDGGRWSWLLVAHPGVFSIGLLVGLNHPGTDSAMIAFDLCSGRAPHLRLGFGLAVSPRLGSSAELLAGAEVAPEH